MQTTKLLIDSTTVAVVERGQLTLPVAAGAAGESADGGTLRISMAALDQLRHLDQTRSVVIYLPAGQARAASWFREQGFTIGRIPFESLAAEAEVVVLPEHRAIDLPGAIRVPVLGLAEVIL